MVMNAQRFDIDAFQIARAVRHFEHPPLEPFFEALRSPRLLCIARVESVIALEVTLHRRWMRAARLEHHRYGLGLWEQNSVGIAERDARVHELFAGDDDHARREP